MQIVKDCLIAAQIACIRVAENFGYVPGYEWDEFPKYSINARPKTIRELEIIWNSFPEIYDPEERENQVVMYDNDGKHLLAIKLSEYYCKLGDNQPDYAKLFWLHDMLFKGIDKPQGLWWWECD